MRRVAAVLSTAAVVLWTAGVFAQAPNFAGKWTRDAEKTAAANPNMGGGGGGGRRGGGGGGFGGGDMTIKQAAGTFTIERETQNGTQSTEYKLDGSPVTVPAGRGGQGTAKASVKGNTIVIETTSEGQNGPMTTTATYSMEGEWLVVATTRPGRGGGEPVTTKTYYKKGM